MLHHVGLPKTDLDYIYCDGPVMNETLVQGDARMTLFTGSQAVADKLTIDLKGRVKLEDAGFDWKILGPDPTDVDYVVWQSDQDAYAFSGQKCSAQSMLLVHENWMKVGVIDKLAARAGQRSLEDMTLGPVLTWSTDKILARGMLDFISKRVLLRHRGCGSLWLRVVSTGQSYEVSIRDAVSMG